MKLKAGKLSLIDFPSKDATEKQSIVNVDEDDGDANSEEKVDLNHSAMLDTNSRKYFTARMEIRTSVGILEK